MSGNGINPCPNFLMVAFLARFFAAYAYGYYMKMIIMIIMTYLNV